MSKSIEALLAEVESRLLDMAPEALGSEPSLRAVNEQALAAGGGRKRARITLQVSMDLGLSPADAVCLASVVEALHQASLVHDDLQDKDAERRGQPAVWSVHGDAVAICLGDALIANSFAQLSHLSNPLWIGTLLTHVSQAVSNMSAGQALDCTQPNLDDFSVYLQVTANKSGSLLSLPLVLPMVCAGVDQALIDSAWRAARAIGIGYQLADDWVDREQDRGQHLNGYWVLFNECGSDAAVELASQFNHQILSALRDSNGCPRAVKLAIAHLAGWLRGRFPELSEAA